MYHKYDIKYSSSHLKKFMQSRLFKIALTKHSFDFVNVLKGRCYYYGVKHSVRNLYFFPIITYLPFGLSY